MRKLYKLTSLEDSFECNFNVLINGSPKLLGVRDLLIEWIKIPNGLLPAGNQI